GLAITGPLADWSAKYLARKNKGIYEPEFRLYLVIPQAITGCLGPLPLTLLAFARQNLTVDVSIGLYMFGITSSNTTKYGWFWPDFFFALEFVPCPVRSSSTLLSKMAPVGEERK